MPRRFVDLSIFLENDGVSDPPAFAPKIEYFTHRNTYAQIEPFFPGLKQEDLPDGEGWAVERVHLSTHNGTHLDAPYHFHSTMNRALGGQERAIAIDEVPLEWCFQPGVKLDFRHLRDGHVGQQGRQGRPARARLQADQVHRLRRRQVRRKQRTQAFDRALGKGQSTRCRAELSASVPARCTHPTPAARA